MRPCPVACQSSVSCSSSPPAFWLPLLTARRPCPAATCSPSKKKNRSKPKWKKKKRKKKKEEEEERKGKKKTKVKRPLRLGTTARMAVHTSTRRPAGSPPRANATANIETAKTAVPIRVPAGARLAKLGVARRRATSRAIREVEGGE